MRITKRGRLGANLCHFLQIWPFHAANLSPVHVREIYRERRGERERKLGEKEGTKKKRKNISL